MLFSTGKLVTATAAAFFGLSGVNLSAAAEPSVAAQTAPDSPSSTTARSAIRNGAAFLLKVQQPDGAFTPAQAPIGMHALVLRALVQAPGIDAQSPAIQKGYEKLLSYQLDSGGIYKDSLANYNTAIALSALAAANNPDYRPAIDKGVAYLKGLQWTDTIAGPKGEKIDVNSPWYGGWGYGGFSRGPGRPDLSNAQMTLEALHDAGLKPEDPAYQAALKFVSRMQNASETNDQPWAGDDGGFIYGPSADGKGESFAGEYTDASGKRLLRSYGSMTYAGLKSMIYAGLTKDDPRVKAAWNWIRNNWTLDENPGIKAADPANAQYGLYYYYYTLAKALRVYGEPVFVDAQGVRHDWRIELIAKLASLQREDGSWAGDKRWMEDNPVLTTSYALSALGDAVASLNEKPAGK